MYRGKFYREKLKDSYTYKSCSLTRTLQVSNFSSVGLGNFRDFNREISLYAYLLTDTLPMLMSLLDALGN